MKICMDNNNNKINPFTFANIYEKEKKEHNSFNKYYNQSLTNENENGKLIEYFSNPVDLFSTNYILIELVPNENLDKVQITYETANIYNFLNNSKSININKLLQNIPYYYFIKAKKYQQVDINLILNKNNLQIIPFEYIEFYEFSDKFHYNIL